MGPTTLQAFPALTACRSGEDTVLRGPLPDPSALYGVINEVEALGLELLELRTLRPQEGREPARVGRSKPQSPR